MTDKAPTRRGLILLALFANYPHPLTSAAIEKQVAPFYAGADDRALARDLAYLRERELITRTETPVGAVKLVTWVMTAAGVDVVEGTVKVAGVEIGS